MNPTDKLIAVTKTLDLAPTSRVSITLRNATFAWVYTKTTTSYILKDCTIEFTAQGDVGVAAFILREKKLCHAGHVYLQPVGDTEVTKIATRCNGGNREGDAILETSGLKDVLDLYVCKVDHIMEASCNYIKSKFKSNITMVRRYEGKSDFNDIGYDRLYQIRDTHHGLETTGVAGIGEMQMFEFTWDMWLSCVKWCLLISGFDKTHYGSLVAEKRENVDDALACLTLSLTAVQFQWNEEKLDSVCNPVVKLGTRQDCEDCAVVQSSVFKWLKANIEKAEYNLRHDFATYLAVHLVNLVEDVRMAAGWVDTEIANPKSISCATISGHAWAVLHLKKERNGRRIYINEGTEPFYVFRSSNDVIKDRSWGHSYFGDAILIGECDITNCTWGSPKLQPVERYRTVDVEFTDTASYFIGEGVKDDSGLWSVGAEVETYLKGEAKSTKMVPPEIEKMLEDWVDFDARPSLQMAITLFRKLGLQSCYTGVDTDYSYISPRIPRPTISSFDLDHDSPWRYSTSVQLPFSTVYCIETQKYTSINTKR